MQNKYAFIRPPAAAARDKTRFGPCGLEASMRECVCTPRMHQHRYTNTTSSQLAWQLMAVKVVHGRYLQAAFLRARAICMYVHACVSRACDRVHWQPV